MTRLSFADIYQEIMLTLDVHSQIGLARKLNITPPAVADAKSKKVIPETWYQKIYEMTGIPKEKLLDNAVERIETILQDSINELKEHGDIQDGNIIPSKRLAFLKGNMSIKAFAKKCKVDEKSMKQYLEIGYISNYNDLFLIAHATEVATSWLNKGEPWLTPHKIFPGLSICSHEKISRVLRRYKKGLQNISELILEKYPPAGPDFDKFESIQDIIKHIESSCKLLSETLAEEYPDEYSRNLYDINTMTTIPPPLEHNEIDSDFI